MRKTSAKVGLTIVLLILLSLSILMQALSQRTVAQTPNAATNSAVTTAPASATNATLTADTFAAYGSIASLIFDTPVLELTSGKNISTSVLPGKTFILTGFWHLKVVDGKVTSFTAKFTKVHLDATNRHTHQITNFHSTNNTPVILNANATTSISGRTDVALNGLSAWTNVKTTILIDKFSTITISLDPKDTANHFKGQSIYGVVNLLIGKEGKHFITFPHL